MGDPHRHQDFTELCQDCREPANSFCLRCGAPVCEAHAPPTDDQRCAECEARYDDETLMLRRAANGEIQGAIGRVTVGIILVWVASGLPTWPLVFGPAVGNGVIGVVLGLAAGVGSTAAVGWWYHRTPPGKKSAKRKLVSARAKFLRN